MKPRARANGLVVQELAEETLVYDLDRHKAHCLTATAATIWRLCDGKRDESALARQVEKQLGVAPAAEVVELALRDLGRARLLEEPLPSDRAVSRRRLIARLGGAIALPLVASIVSPTAAQAATCRLALPVSPAQCNASNPNALGCCCTNGRICSNLGGGGCNGPRC